MEIWKDISGYEGLYQISNYGNLRSLVDKYGRKRIMPRKLQKSSKGYLQTRIYKNHVGKTVKIHRLVAEAFIPNPNNYPMINHKDEDKTNNCVYLNDDGSVDCAKSNLEWCDNQYNANWGTGIERMAKKHINHPSKSKPVKQYSLDGQFIKEYPSQTEAARQTGFLQASISQSCRRKISQTNGYIFTFTY